MLTSARLKLGNTSVGIPSPVTVTFNSRFDLWDKSGLTVAPCPASVSHCDISAVSQKYNDPHWEKEMKKQTRYVYVEIIAVRCKSHVYVQNVWICCKFHQINKNLKNVAFIKMCSCPYKLPTRILGTRVSTRNTSGHISLGDLSELCLYFSHCAGRLLHPVKRLSVSTTDSFAFLANTTAAFCIFTATHTPAKGMTWLATSKRP